MIFHAGEMSSEIIDECTLSADMHTNSKSILTLIDSLTYSRLVERDWSHGVMASARVNNELQYWPSTRRRSSLLARCSCRSSE